MTLRNNYLLTATCLLILTGCTEQVDPVHQFADTYKQGLLSLCKTEPGCVNTIETYFDGCLDRQAVAEMLAANLDAQSEKNQQIAAKTMRCIEQKMEQ